MENKNTFLSGATITTIQTLLVSINDNLHKKLSIENLRKEAGFNATKLKAAFAQVTGLTIHQYIIQQRLQKAMHLLQTTDKPMKDIAASIGYSERNFYALFQKHNRCSPRTFRSLPQEAEKTFLA